MKIIHLKLKKGVNRVRMYRPLVTSGAEYLRVQRCLVSWMLQNVRESNNTLVKNSTNLVVHPGYYTFSDLQKVLKTNDITIEKLADNKVTIQCANALNLKNFGLLLGFEKDQTIASNTLTTSNSPASMTNGLKDILVSSSIVDTSRVDLSLVNSEAYPSLLAFSLPIDTTQSLNGTFTEYNLNALKVPCIPYNSQELVFWVASLGSQEDYEVFLTLSIGV